MTNFLADRPTRQRVNRRLIPLGMRACGTCLAVRSVGQFSRKGNGTQSRCKVCVSTVNAAWRAANPDYDREWYQANAEQRREYHREYQRTNPDKRRASAQRRRARKAAAQVEDFTSADLREFWIEAGHLMSTDGRFMCIYCSAAEAEHDDHVQPLSKGGAQSRANLVPACSACNLSKGAADPVAYANQRYGLTLSWPA